MDGLRKVPDNVPNQEMVAAHLGQPLTAIPDPFGTHESFGAHMNARLRAFLDAFGFDYTFKSSTECYRSGAFDRVLLKVLERHEQIREGRHCPPWARSARATYSPILPISPKTGRVLQVRIEETPARGRHGRVPRRGRHADRGAGHRRALQDAVAGRLGDALDGARRRLRDVGQGPDRLGPASAAEICRVLGGTPPENLTYELFLDEQGQKISKSKGNGLTIEEWLRYATRGEPRALPLHATRSKAKRLYFDVIPRHVDEYEQLPRRLAAPGAGASRLGNPRLAHPRRRPARDDRLPAGLSFGMLLNLASVVNADDPAVLWGFIAPLRAGRHARDLAPPRRAGRARRRLLPRLRRGRRSATATPTAQERAALEELLRWLRDVPDGADGETIQYEVYEIGKRHGFANLRDWFTRPLRGPARPERGAALRLLRRDLRRRPNSVALIESALAREAAAA